MKKSTKLTLTAVLLITVFTAHTSVCRAEYEYWFWETLSEPFGVIADAGEGVCRAVGNCTSGLFKFIFGESKRESKQTDLPENLQE